MPNTVRKKAIRARMAATGEKWTTAARLNDAEWELERARRETVLAQDALTSARRNAAAELARVD